MLKPSFSIFQRKRPVRTTSGTLAVLIPILVKYTPFMATRDHAQVQKRCGLLDFTRCSFIWRRLTTSRCVGGLHFCSTTARTSEISRQLFLFIRSNSNFMMINAAPRNAHKTKFIMDSIQNISVLRSTTTRPTVWTTISLFFNGQPN